MGRFWVQGLLGPMRRARSPASTGPDLAMPVLEHEGTNGPT